MNREIGTAMTDKSTPEFSDDSDFDDDDWTRQEQDVVDGDHEQAILMDILRQASLGGDLDILLDRLEDVIEEAADAAYAQGAYQ